MSVIATPFGATRRAVPRQACTLHLPGGWPSGRRQPSAAVRRRCVVTALTVVAAIGFLLGAGSLTGAGQASPLPQPAPADAAPVAAFIHIVQPGDTLWSLARRIQPNGDVRPLVARLRAVSGGGPLQPGQLLRLAV